MKQKIKVKNYGVTKLNLSNWNLPESQALNVITKKFKFPISFNLVEHVLRVSHSIKSINAVIKSNPSTKGKIAYIQETLLRSDSLSIQLSINIMGKSIRDDLIDLDSKFDELTENIHDLSVLLFKYLEKLNNLPTKNIIKQTDHRSITNKELKKIALMSLCRIFLIGSLLEPTLTTNTDSNKITGTLFQFIIEIKPFFEMQSGIKLGTDASIGRNLFDLRKIVIGDLEKSK